MGIEKISSFKSDKEFLEYAEEKARLQSGYLYGTSAEIGVLIAGSHEQAKIARNFGETIGTGIHISNGLGNFALFETENSFKTYQDSLSDIKNGRLTIPVLNKYRNNAKQILRLMPDNYYRNALSSVANTIRYNKYLKNLKTIQRDTS